MNCNLVFAWDLGFEVDCYLVNYFSFKLFIVEMCCQCLESYSRKVKEWRVAKVRKYKSNKWY